MADQREKFDEAILRIYNYTYLDNRFPREYLPGVALLPREMHLVDTILRHPGITLTELSRITGIPKSMISKMSRELEKREIIKRYKVDGNQKEVHYEGTDLGRQVFDAHIRFHRIHDKKFYDYFSALPEEQQIFLVETLSKYADYMRDFSTERTIR